MWQADVRAGRGIFMFHNGEYYLGDFKNDMPNGIGKKIIFIFRGISL